MTTAMPWSKAFCCGTCLVTGMLVLAGLALAQNAEPPRVSQAGSPAAGGAAGKSNERLREGTKLIDVTGTFQAAGADSVSFLVNGNKESYRVLQNLTLQRVSFALEDNRALRQWIISGTITEYRGTNFLLLTKAVIQLPEGEAAGE